MLPDDVLLEIFDFYLRKIFRIEEWKTLAYVCRRWKSVVLQSPRRLNLRLLCTSKTPVKNILDLWPPLPFVIQDSYPNFTSSADNIITALEHNDRVCQIDLNWCTNSQLGYVTAAMQKPFPELTYLHLGYGGGLESQILPASFLGGTAPRLQSLFLHRIPFPGLPKLLLSATHLVDLNLSNIPCSGYMPAEAMATSLSALTGLKYLRLRFQYPRPRPALESLRSPPPPLTRSILPSLTLIKFKGASEYLEKILAWIDAPRLLQMFITFFNQTIFDTPQLFQFISRRPTLRAPEMGHIAFHSEAIIFKFPSRTSDYVILTMEIPCTVSEWQLSSLEQVCTSSLPPVSTLEDLYIFENRRHPLHWQGDIENMLWLEFLHPFVAVKNLYLCKEFVPRIAPTLQELVGGGTAEVLPTLENIFLEGFQPSGSLHEGIEKFISARRLTTHPVAVSRWDRDSKQESRWEIFVS